MGYKKKDVKSEDAQHDNGDTDNLSSDNDSEIEGEDNAGGEGEDDAGGKDKNNNGGEFSKDDASAEDENNNGGEDEDNADRNGKTLNEKMRVRNANKTSNLDKIVTSKLAFSCIANSLVDTPTSGTIVSHYLAVPAFCLPTLPWLGFFVVPLISLDAFLHNPSLTFLVNGGTIKFLAEVIINPFGNNPSVIAHPSHNSCTSK